jgi:uncharacterized protein (TIGR02145 family)
MKLFISAVIFSVWAINCSLCQDTMYIHKSDGTISKFSVNNIDSIVFYATYSNGNGSTNTNPTVTDVDGNVYHTVTIGYQTWMVENLKTTKYNDGTPLTYINSLAAWQNITTGAYCWYNFQQTTFKNTNFGPLYNIQTVENGNLCPAGWRIPNNSDWKSLIEYLGGDKLAAVQMMETGTTHWYQPNSSATNTSGFTALPSGSLGEGNFSDIGVTAEWWSSDNNGVLSKNSYGYYFVWLYSQMYSASNGANIIEDPDQDVLNYCYPNAYAGNSVRCIQVGN